MQESTRLGAGRLKGGFGLAFAVLVALVPFALQGWEELYVNFLESDLPSITLPNPPAGVGLDASELKIQVFDEGSGIDELIVRGEQDNQVYEIFKKKYPGKKVLIDTLSLDLTQEFTKFHEGEARLVITTFDRSYWQNSRKTTLDLTVDYGRPSIEVLSTQHNATIGGAQLVVYKLSEPKTTISGVMVGGWPSPGFQAAKIDPDFKDRPDIYFSFFAIPVDYDEKRDKIRLFARDAVGNVGYDSINYRVRTRKYATRDIELTSDFLTNKVPELLPEFYELDSKMNAREHPRIPSFDSTEELVQGFRSINEDFRQLTSRALQSILSRPKSSLYWDGVFLRLARASQVAAFGETRYYKVKDLSVGESFHAGVDLASTANAEVRAANGGIVTFADTFGVYGKTLMIDHGFGLASLYGHLSELVVEEGKRVQKGDVIAKTGASGLADGDHLHFEFRLHGVPVRPEEWWDKNWVQDHVFGKLNQVKKQEGIPISVSLR